MPCRACVFQHRSDYTHVHSKAVFTPVPVRVPLVHVAFTPAKIDRTRSGCGPVTRSHLFRTRSETRTVSITKLLGQMSKL